MPNEKAVIAVSNIVESQISLGPTLRIKIYV